MRFALVNDQRLLPLPGLNGHCANCGAPVIAKCGAIRAHHWAHKGERNCDVWWENRTQWHYAWQDRFPRDWQEVRRQAPCGEWHIADVHTPLGLTIEYQYSYLDSKERAARESFYRNLVWVVSGARLAGDLRRFEAGRPSFFPVWKKGVYLVPDPRQAFSTHWLTSGVPVLFDFAGAAGLSEQTAPLARPLWCLLPGRVFGMAVVLQVSRDTFVRLAHERAHLLPIKAMMEGVAHRLMEAARARQAQVVRTPPIRPMPPRPQKWRKPFRRRLLRF